MKKYLYIIPIILCSLSLLCLSCVKETDLGFPNKITFVSDGGEMEVKGTEPFIYAIIQDYNGNHGSVENGEDGKIYNVYDWLKVEYVELYNEVLKVYAMPNTSGHQRTLSIEVWSGQDYDVIKVIQD